MSAIISIAAALTGFAAVVVSALQWVNASRKLRLDLYDKRIAVYMAAVELIRRLIDDRCRVSEIVEHRIALKKMRDEAVFLFHAGDGVSEVLDRILETSHAVEEVLPRLQASQELATTHHGIAREMHSARRPLYFALTALRNAMAPYLDFTGRGFVRIVRDYFWA